jgi:hypothetical protein
MRVFALVLTVVAALVVADVAIGRAPPLYRSCKALNARYPHGVGLAKAKDHTSGAPPVTTFKRSTRIYRLAMSYNKGLDRDKDGVACEEA